MGYFLKNLTDINISVYELKQDEMACDPGITLPKTFVLAPAYEDLSASGAMNACWNCLIWLLRLP
jgi:hypothetical protein